MPRMPYRVVFWMSGSAPGHQPGTIRRATLHAAHTDAHAIAGWGGTAQVRYVAPDGQHQVLTVYHRDGGAEDPRRASTPPKRFTVPNTMIAAVPSAVLNTAIWVLRRAAPHVRAATRRIKSRTHPAHRWVDEGAARVARRSRPAGALSDGGAPGLGRWVSLAAHPVGYQARRGRSRSFVSTPMSSANNASGTS